MRQIAFFLQFFAQVAVAQECGIPDDHLQPLGTAMYAISERSDELGTPLTKSGSVIVRWNLAESCIEAMDSNDPDTLDETENQCFHAEFISSNGETALHRADELMKEMPNSVVVVGWAVSDEITEWGLPLMYSRLSIPGHSTLTLNQAAESEFSCSAEKHSPDSE